MGRRNAGRQSRKKPSFILTMVLYFKRRRPDSDKSEAAGAEDYLNAFSNTATFSTSFNRGTPNTSSNVANSDSC